MGSRVELKCHADAVPLSIGVTWMRVINGEEMSIITRHLIPRNVVVLERNVTLMDNGNWRCRISNLAGSNHDDFLVTVLGKALWTIISV